MYIKFRWPNNALVLLVDPSDIKSKFSGKYRNLSNNNEYQIHSPFLLQEKLEMISKIIQGIFESGTYIIYVK